MATWQAPESACLFKVQNKPHTSSSAVLESVLCFNSTKRWKGGIQVFCLRKISAVRKWVKPLYRSRFQIAFKMSKVKESNINRSTSAAHEVMMTRIRLQPTCVVCANRPVFTKTWAAGCCCSALVSTLRQITPTRVNWLELAVRPLLC